jgi:hypothetical protein
MQDEYIDKVMMEIANELGKPYGTLAPFTQKYPLT